MKKVEIKTPSGFETFLFLDGALVRLEDILEELVNEQKRQRALEPKPWTPPMEPSQN